MRFFALIGLLALPCLAQPPSPQLIATQPRFSLSPDYVGIGIQSRCGDDWVFLYTFEWACVRPEGDRLQLIDTGSYSGTPSSALWQRLARGPTATDPRVYMATSGGFFGIPTAAVIDPITMARDALGAIAGLPLEPVSYAYRDGDDAPSLITAGPGPSALLALPGGEQPPFQLRASIDVAVVLSGQFDADGSSELGWLSPGSGVLRFRDAGTLIDEPWTPPGNFADFRPPWTGDWDDDGRDEIALTAASSNTLALLDPDLGGSYRVLALPMPDIYRALGLLDWSAPGSCDLVALGNGHVAIVDPRTGTVLQSQSLAQGGTGRVITSALDWDHDGDQDMLWFDSGTLRLLRNPEGARVLQWSHGESHALGYFQQHGESQLVVVVEAGGELLFRRLKPRTLGLISEDIVPNLPFPTLGNVQSPRYLLGDFHPSPGPEILRISSTLLRAYGLNGEQLWERAPSAGREFGQVQVADGACVGTICPPLGVTEFTPGSSYTMLRVLDGSDGSSTWNSTATTEASALFALTDVTGDDLPELMVVTSQRLRALDARDGLVRWDVPLNHNRFVKAVRRSGVTLAVLFDDTMLALFDSDGSARNRRLLQTNGQCDSQCSLSYLRRPSQAGDWIISATRPNYLAVREDLVGEVTAVDDPGQGFRSLQVASAELLNGVDYSRVVTWELDDRLFNSDFEN